MRTLSRITKTKQLLLTTLISLHLAACNSDGNDANNVVDPDRLSGQMSGMRIAGLSYQTDTQSGFTDAEGRFHYKAGETISFSVGNLTLTETAANHTVSVFDLAGVTDPAAITYGIINRLQERKRELYSVNSDLFPNLPVYDFDRLSNLLVLLNTIDEDSNIENGIVIPEGLDLSSLSADLKPQESTIYAFQQQLELTGLPGDDELLHPMDALDQFYAQLGEPTKLPVKVLAHIDTDDDGSIDRRSGFEFDDNGNLVLDFADGDNDGIIDDRIGYEYDSRGNQTLRFIDSNNDEVIDQRTVSTYDENDKPLTQLTEIDYDRDGYVEERHTVENSYHDNGELATQSDTTEVHYEEEDVTLLSVEKIYRNDAGLLIRQEQLIIDYDGTTQEHYNLFERDDDGRITREEAGDPSDGTIYYIKTIQFNADGTLYTETTDSGGDGEIDTTKEIHIVYDSEQRETQRTTYHDGELVDSIDTRYDAHGNRVSKTETNALGESWQTVYEYDDQHRETSVAYYSNVSESPILTIQTTKRYSPNVTYTRVDFDSDGNTTNFASSVYNDRGQLVESIQHGDDGYETIYRNEFNEQGWLTLESSLRTQGELSRDSFISYQYDAQGRLESVTQWADTEPAYREVKYYEYENLLSWRQAFERY